MYAKMHAYELGVCRAEALNHRHRRRLWQGGIPRRVASLEASLAGYKMAGEGQHAAGEEGVAASKVAVAAPDEFSQTARTRHDSGAHAPFTPPSSPMSRPSWTVPSSSKQSVESKRFFAPTPDDLVCFMAISCALAVLTPRPAAQLGL